MRGGTAKFFLKKGETRSQIFRYGLPKDFLSKWKKNENGKRLTKWFLVLHFAAKITSFLCTGLKIQDIDIYIYIERERERDRDRDRERNKKGIYKFHTCIFVFASSLMKL